MNRLNKKINFICVFATLSLIFFLSSVLLTGISYPVYAESNEFYGISINQDGNERYINYEEYHFYDSSDSKNNAWFPDTITEATDSISQESADPNIEFGNGRTLLTESQYTLYPYCSVCLITTHFDSDTNGVGTGVLVGPKTVLTCSHLMYNATYGWPLEISVAPGGHRNDDGDFIAPFGTFTSWSTLSVGVNFITHDNNDDWALLDLTDDIGNITGYFGTSASLSLGDTVRLYGYHADNPDKLAYGAGIVTELSTYKFYHNCDSLIGSSGGPLTLGTNIAVGIHSGEYNSIQDCACKVSSYIVGWISERL